MYIFWNKYLLILMTGFFILVQVMPYLQFNVICGMKPRENQGMRNCWPYSAGRWNQQKWWQSQHQAEYYVCKKILHSKCDIKSWAHPVWSSQQFHTLVSGKWVVSLGAYSPWDNAGFPVSALAESAWACLTVYILKVAHWAWARLEGGA